MPGRYRERTSRHVDSHELSSEFLLRVWPEDCAAALVRLDQQTVLRQVFPHVCQSALATTVAHHIRRATFRSPARPWLPPGAASADHRASHCAHDVEIRKRQRRSIFTCNRSGLHLRRAHKERHALLTPRPWTRALLATQRRASDAAVGEAAC
jgi:hypothetical protein